MNLIYIANCIFGIVLCLVVFYCVKLHTKVEHLYVMISGLAARISEMQKEQDEIRTKHSELMDAEDTAESRIAAKIEKRWDEGLSQMLAFNPFAQELEGDNR